MHWNVIEYARGEAVEVWWYQAWYRGTIVGVHVQPYIETKYYVRLANLTVISKASQVRRVQQ